MSESQLHIDLKQWSAKQYLKQGIEKKDILFEKVLCKTTVGNLQWKIYCGGLN